ncbi:hypothetical protein B296_00039328 [Ensete ventricosum]|uniref:Uncharacterized protein n=1 Tax=Ensete ventricosum TaxID=4639 RepID=A0A426XW14_ENSVE|nr:hypothetical protein B296_00039328 [Ensete ventricosum]
MFHLLPFAAISSDPSSRATATPLQPATSAAAKRLPVAATAPAPVAASQPSLFPSKRSLFPSFTAASAPRSLTAALNPQAYVGLFFYSNCCSRMLLPTAATLDPATASKSCSR